MQVENAIIMAAGTSSRFAPLSYEHHKALTLVRGEVLIERQIRQLKEAGIPEIYIVTGYKAEQFQYLKARFGVQLLPNPEYLSRNNNSSIWAARRVLGSSYVCSSDNYFPDNPFEREVPASYYAAQYASGHTEEWCLKEDEKGCIREVRIGGENAWYMMGHTYWSPDFSRRFLRILTEEYDRPETAPKLWEQLLAEHLDELKMQVRRYPPGAIFEFDTLEELRVYDESYRTDSRSRLLKKAAAGLGIREEDICHITPLKGDGTKALGFAFDSPLGHHTYWYAEDTLNG